MKICVLVSSAENLKQAGVRIRYRRIQESFNELGHELRIKPIDAFADSTNYTDDAYIISKCYDARSFLVAKFLRSSDRLVGIDLFDDYYSQSNDSRLSRFRKWLHTILKYADFALCSTPALRDVAATFAPDLPSLVMNDPSSDIDEQMIKNTVNQKLGQALDTSVLPVAWFGIGDNPNFPVGLRDLVAFGDDLARLRGHGFAVRLEILTNKRSLTPDGLVMLSRLCVPYTVHEWSLEEEDAMLARNLLCFIPVNGQNFSVAKSLNRAITALCAGAQVLSAGYPLYEPLAPFIYRDSLQLIGDIKNETPLLREETVSRLVEMIQSIANPGIEAAKLIEFLYNCPKRKVTSAGFQSKTPFAAIIHGKDTLGPIHKFASQIGALSVGSAAAPDVLNYDILCRFKSDGIGLFAFVSYETAELLDSDVQSLLSHHGKIGKNQFYVLDVSRLLPDRIHPGSAMGATNYPTTIFASYGHIMALTEYIVQRMFPQIDCHIADGLVLPYWQVQWQQTGPQEAG